jgi:hypothetical protein
MKTSDLPIKSLENGGLSFDFGPGRDQLRNMRLIRTSWWNACPVIEVRIDYVENQKVFYDELEHKTQLL